VRSGVITSFDNPRSTASTVVLSARATWDNIKAIVKPQGTRATNILVGLLVQGSYTRKTLFDIHAVVKSVTEEVFAGLEWSSQVAT